MRRRGVPAPRFEALGYNVATHGQKTYNGVAILSKRPLEDVRRGLPGDDGDEQARYIEAVVSGRPAGARRLDLPAERQSDRHRRSSPTSSPGWTGCTPTRATCWRWRSRWCCAATTTSSPSPSDADEPGRLDERRPVPAREPRAPSAR